ncbi:hypothetical protein GCM10027051_31490 [Niabella terrae]
MKFDEQIAAELKTMHDISDRAVQTWRTRGTIPDKYIKFPAEDLAAKEVSVLPRESQALMDILNIGIFNISKIADDLNLNYELQDIIYGKQLLREYHFKKLKKYFKKVAVIMTELSELLQQSRKSAEDKAYFWEQYANLPIKWAPLIGNKLEYNRLMQARPDLPKKTGLLALNLKIHLFKLRRL